MYFLLSSPMETSCKRTVYYYNQNFDIGKILYSSIRTRIPYVAIEKPHLISTPPFLTTTGLLSTSINLSFHKRNINDIIHCEIFGIVFFFFNQHNSLETHQIVKYIDVHHFSLLISISCPDCTTVGRTIFPLKGIFFFSFFLSVFGYCKLSCCKDSCTSFCVSLHFLFLWDNCSRMKVLGHMIAAYLVL